MCRSIKTLYNIDPPVTKREITEASLQFVRKVSGYRKPSQVNEEIFNETIHTISEAVEKLLANLETKAIAKARELNTVRT